MRRFFIYMSYDGSAYNGWQVQPGAVTVQGVTEDALTTLLRCRTSVVGAGRTDAGVHARMMVAHFECEDLTMEMEVLTERMNRILPPDIAVERIVEVCPDAHARFHARARSYIYNVTLKKSPFDSRYACRLYNRPDFDAMNDACAALLDYTDFTSFSKLHTDVKTNNCKISSARWTDCGDGSWSFSITSDRFLRNMVRAIVGTMLDVGRGKISIEGFRHIIEARDRCRAGSSAPAHALFLADIIYPDSVFAVL